MIYDSESENSDKIEDFVYELQLMSILIYEVLNHCKSIYIYCNLDIDSTPENRCGYIEGVRGKIYFTIDESGALREMLTSASAIVSSLITLKRMYTRQAELEFYLKQISDRISSFSAYSFEVTLELGHEIEEEKQRQGETHIIDNNTIKKTKSVNLVDTRSDDRVKYETKGFKIMGDLSKCLGDRRNRNRQFLCYITYSIEILREILDTLSKFSKIINLK